MCTALFTVRCCETTASRYSRMHPNQWSASLLSLTTCWILERSSWPHPIANDTLSVKALIPLSPLLPLPCRTWKKNKLPAAVHVNGYENGPDESALRSPPPSAQTPGPVPASAPYIISATPSKLDSENLLASGGGCHSTAPLSFHLTFFTSLTDASVHRSSPQAQRRDIGLAVTHRSAATPDLFRLLAMLCHRCLRGRPHV